MVNKEVFKIGLNRYLTKAVVYKVSGKFLVFVETKEVRRAKVCKSGVYVGIVDQVDDFSLLGVCQYGGKYTKLPVMPVYEVWEWRVL